MEWLSLKETPENEENEKNVPEMFRCKEKNIIFGRVEELIVLRRLR